MSNTAKSNAPGPAIRASAEQYARRYRSTAAGQLVRDLLAQIDTQADAQRTLDSLAVMLGWGNTPPRHIFEAEIRALKARLDTLTREREELKARVQKLEGSAAHGWSEAEHQRGHKEEYITMLEAAEATVATLKVDYVENQATLTRLCLMLNAENFSELEATVATLEQRVKDFDHYMSLAQQDRMQLAEKLDALEREVAHLRTYADAHGPVRNLLSRLPFPDCLPAAEIIVEDDGDLGIDWDIRRGATVSVSLSPTGVVRWAALIDDWKAHGHFILPSWSDEFNEAMTRLGRAQPLPPKETP